MNARSEALLRNHFNGYSLEWVVTALTTKIITRSEKSRSEMGIGLF